MTWRSAKHAVLGGVLGFLALNLALLAAFLILLPSLASAIGFFGTSSISSWRLVLLVLVVPGLVFVSGGLLAWGLGAGKERRLAAGLLVLVAIAVFEMWNTDYAPYNSLEATAFTLGAGAASLEAVIGKTENTEFLTSVIVLISLALVLLALLPGAGFFAALLAWVLLPLVARALLEGGGV
jgi:hypothetical protein